MNLQTRLIIGFLIATCLTGAVATVVGITTINRNTLDEVQRKVQQDIHTAELIYNYNLERLKYQLEFISLRSPLEEAIREKDPSALKGLEALIRPGTTRPTGDHSTLDMLTLVNAQGHVIYRVANPPAKDDNLLWDPVVRKCLMEKKPQASAVTMPLITIEDQNPRLSARAVIPIIKTPQSVELIDTMLIQGMVLRAAYPVFGHDGRLLGALVGGILVNRDYDIVDTIKETVYHDERYRGRDIGFATIFLGPVRISTNVKTRDNQRAVGTIVSQEVYNQVILRGKDWVGRAFVVNDWYISAYSPIYDIDKRIIGMFYTGILEAKYRDMTLNTIWMFLGITSLGMVTAFFISFWLGNSIIRRIRILKTATQAISAGNLEYQLPPGRSSGFDMLDEAFNNMARSLKDRDDRLQKAFQRITRTERLASLGQMAAGVAHEINNPLGGILLYSNLVMEEMDESHPGRNNMEKIIYQTDRCKKIVQNLLDFARTPSGDMRPLNINDVVHTSLNLVKDQSMFLGVRVETDLAPDLPLVQGDVSRLEEVFLNFFINAADAMEGKGTLKVTSWLSSTRAVKISIRDNGKGIDKAYLPHIFEPFFTTKDPGQGTGLGLSITYGIVQKHNGLIDVESEVGKGTTFSITLPSCLDEKDESCREGSGEIQGGDRASKKTMHVLIVDDEESIRDGCSQILTRMGYLVETTGDGLAGLEMIKTGRFDLVLLDIRMPRIEGLDILRIVKKEMNLPCRVVIITGFGSIQLAVEAMRLGAANFITKPFNASELKKAVLDCFTDDACGKPSGEILSTIIGSSDYIEDLKETIRRVAKTDSTVLITGESGTGKELVARTIHVLSTRTDRLFMPVDCSSLVQNLMESELFGHIKGAFSGATESREGRFQMADKGTLFLDEISNIPIDVQAKLLRAIQEQEVPRVGSSIPEKVDVRLITATNKDLRDEITNGNFREDLFYRISVVPIHIKPLREHKSDIAPIAYHYFDVFRIKHNAQAKRLSQEVVKSLTAYSWPGNIRELKNTIERLCVLCENEEVTLSDILYYGQDTRAKAPVVDPFSGRLTLVEVEKEHIEKALRHFNYQINKTAKFLGIDRKTLRSKIRNYGIDIREE